MRDIKELAEVDDPAWPELQGMIAACGAAVELLPVDREEGRRTLLQMQVTARSTLGALSLNCGGLLFDGGWLRVFGGGCSAGDLRSLPSLGQVNGFPTDLDPDWFPAAGLVVGQDVLGGVFALNGHNPAALGRPGEAGEMTYFAPDTLAWEALEGGHSAWFTWLLSGALEQFYEGLRWPGWREELEGLSLSQGITVYPPLWSKEAHADLAATSRRPAPMRELLGFAIDTARQLGPGDPGPLGEV